MSKLRVTAALILICAQPGATWAGTTSRLTQSPRVDGAGERDTRAAEITEKPRPDTDFTGGRVVSQGQIVVRMVLRANGKVSDVSIVKGGTPQMNKAVIKAAKKIKFTPAIKDGRKVSQWVTIEYNFKSEETEK